MTPLGKIIQQEIDQTGPMPVSRYMDLCLSHPKLGYYTTNNPIGTAGDFTTAPEISQMFGEMLGIWLIQAWQDQGAPERFVLAELGPGRGTLMADILRVAAQFPEFLDAMQIALVETSPVLRQIQSNALKNHSIMHLDRVEQIPDLPLVLVANEFFDALPIEQYVFSDAGWQERRVDFQDGRFEFLLAKPVQNAVLDRLFPDLPNGILVETSPLSLKIAREIGRRIRRFGGAALLIDYGDLSGVSDTFQAVKDHSSSSPLTFQGQSDLTAHVQFQPLCDAAQCQMQFTSQGYFLENIGISARANALAETALQQDIDTIISAHHRLVHPDEMGKLFKVMALRSIDTAPLTGFDDAP
ncbi:MAG: SAM-dependent methyltransferase [Rhodobacteraceae bacterium]|nr:SAM-dependent methyltransferase [Paracoccaceae bacterium]